MQRAQALAFIEADHVLSITPYVALRYVGSRDDFGIFAATFALYSSVSAFYFCFWATLYLKLNGADVHSSALDVQESVQSV